jgi:hypothetical protein
VAYSKKTFTLNVFTSTPFERRNIFTRIKGLLFWLCWDEVRLVTEVWDNASIPSPKDYLKMRRKRRQAASVTNRATSPKICDLQLRRFGSPKSH